MKKLVIATTVLLSILLGYGQEKLIQEQALLNLKNGNQRFVNGNDFSHELVEPATKQSVWQSIEDILKVNHEVKELVDDGELKILSAIYNVSSGEMEWLGEHPKQ